MPSGDNVVKTSLASIAVALIVASILGTVAMFKQMIQFEEWIIKHEEVAALYIEDITRLSEQANKGDRWTRQMHEDYEREKKDQSSDHERRINLLESNDRIIKFQLSTMDQKLDVILEQLKSHDQK